MLLTLAAAAIAILLLATGAVRWSDVFIDTELLLVLFALLLAVEILRASGSLDVLVKRVTARFRTTRSFAFALVLFSGVLAMFVTNDVALFVVIPFTVIASRFSDFDVEDAVILEIVAVNLLGCLTPLGNPQNLFVYRQAQWNAGEFVLAMLPFVVWCAVGLVVALYVIPSGARDPGVRGGKLMPAAPPPGSLAPLGMTYAGVICFTLVLLHIAHALPAWPAAVAAAIAWLFFLRRRVDLWIVPLFFFVFIIVAGASVLGLRAGEHLYFAAIALSQVISNVPATILLSPSVDNSWIELLYGANAGGAGTIVASLANLLGWRIYVRESNRDPRFFRRLNAINFAFLAWAAGGGWLILRFL